MPWVCLQCLLVVFPGHTTYFNETSKTMNSCIWTNTICKLLLFYNSADYLKNDFVPDRAATFPAINTSSVPLVNRSGEIIPFRIVFDTRAPVIIS